MKNAFFAVSSEVLENESALSFSEKEKEENSGPSRASDPVSIYLKEISKVPLLSYEEEQKLAKRIRRQNNAIAAIQGKLQNGCDDKEREDLEKLLRDHHEKATDMRQEFVSSNLRLVVSIAKKYLGSHPHLFSDLIQEGNLGLMRAVEKFDGRKRFKFSTYASYWIRQYMARSICNKDRAVRVTVHTWEKYYRFLRVAGQMTQKYGQEPSLQEIAKKMRTSRKELALLISTCAPMISLNATTGEKDESEMQDFISGNAMDPEQVAIVKQEFELLHGWAEIMMGNLSAIESDILRMRLLDGKTLNYIGKIFDLTRERVRQIESKIVKKLYVAGENQYKKEMRKAQFLEELIEETIL